MKKITNLNEIIEVFQGKLKTYDASPETHVLWKQIQTEIKQYGWSAIIDTYHPEMYSKELFDLASLQFLCYKIAHQLMNQAKLANGGM